MADGRVGVLQATTPDRFIDNEVVTNDAAQSVYRQKVAVVNSDDGPVSTVDKYLGGQVLADQSGAGAVLTFSFSAAVDLVWVLSTGTGTSRADPFGGTPAASTGIPCPADTQQPITVTTSSVKVFAPSGTTVSVWGYRY